MCFSLAWYLLYWCLCRIPSFCPSRPALHPYPSSCVAQDTHLFGLHQWTPLPSGFMWSLVNRESGEKPGRREESEVGFVIPWRPSYWVLLGCQHPSTKAFLSSSLSSSPLILVTTFFPCVFGSRDVGGYHGVTRPGALHHPLCFPIICPHLL